METNNTTTSNGGTEFHRVFLSDVFGDYIPSFHYPGRSAKQIFQTGSSSSS